MNLEKSNYELNLIKDIIDKIKIEGLKKFPDDFIDDLNYEIENIPSKILVIASELFGQYEISTSDGEFFKFVDDFSLAKYYVYSSLQRKTYIKIPSNKSDLINVVKNYEKYFDELVKKIETDIEHRGLSNIKMKLTNEIIQNLNLIRL
ncbi:MAG: hypothetical protein NZM09_01070 [Ignavibacterium sp.]|nr:hypothetical protein [Ignavibacterium sp.]MDW8374263.1 hypothetical protein [Ignavibacteriales bacterium]